MPQQQFSIKRLSLILRSLWILKFSYQTWKKTSKSTKKSEVSANKRLIFTVYCMRNASQKSKGIFISHRHYITGILLHLVLNIIFTLLHKLCDIRNVCSVIRHIAITNCPFRFAFSHLPICGQLLVQKDRKFFTWNLCARFSWHFLIPTSQANLYC